MPTPGILTSEIRNTNNLWERFPQSAFLFTSCTRLIANADFLRLTVSPWNSWPVGSHVGPHSPAVLGGILPCCRQLRKGGELLPQLTAGLTAGQWCGKHWAADQTGKGCRNVQNPTLPLLGWVTWPSYSTLLGTLSFRNKIKTFLSRFLSGDWDKIRRRFPGRTQENFLSPFTIFMICSFERLPF